MKYKFKDWEVRTANKSHVCVQCGESINKGDSYTCITVKTDIGEPTEHYESIKIHHLTSPRDQDCISKYFKDRLWIVDEDPVPSTNVDVHAFEKLLKSLGMFHDRWHVEISNSLSDRFNLMQEENEEFRFAANHNTNTIEELGDMLGVVLGNILWARSNVNENISIYHVLDTLAKKLEKRAKFGYKVRNLKTGATKMTHWQKVLGYLETERDQWEVLAGPKHVHPEIRELLNQKEIEWLEKTGV